jgi:hypothetical protein
VQQLQQNIVFCARISYGCGFLQNMPQHMVLCAISSGLRWAETNDCCPAQLLLLAANTSRSKNPNETEQALTVVFLSVQSSVLPFQLHCPCVAATQRHEAVSLQRWVLPLHSPSPSWLLLLPPECARTLLLPPH